MTRHARFNRRRFQRGSVVRGAVVATAIVAALGLQLAGPRLQCRLACMMGLDWVAPKSAMAPMTPTAAPSPAMAPSCGSPSGAWPAHPCKLALVASATPII